ncbi:MAG: hypothetical protein RBU29_04955 [bacterium]|jgi:hypothetical protein|nr:hypothetical protein [bacterium]
MLLPYDEELQNPESLIAWVQDEGARLDLLEIDDYPKRPLLFSEYRLEPPTITVYRYLPAEPWLNLLCQHSIQYYGPWYSIFIAYRFYFYLELNGLYEIERTWRDRLWGHLASLEDRAFHFTQQILGTLHNPIRFEQAIEKSYQPLGR